MKPRSWHVDPLHWQAIDQIAANRRLTIDSRKIEPHDVFFAFKGDATDGRLYIPSAIDKGVAAIIWDDEGFSWNKDWRAPEMCVPDLKAQLGMIAAHIYGNPSHDMNVIGITGSNGKTSIAYWLTQAFEALGQKSALLGTLGNGFLSHLTPAALTTPDAATLQSLLADYRQQGATHLAMEVSSHAIAQGRAHGVEFDIAIFTNLSHEHLDYHGSMHVYGQTKARLFDWEGLRAGVINIDDPFGAQLYQSVRIPKVLSYGLNQADIYAKRLDISLSGMQMEVLTPWGGALLKSQMVGRFNAYNLLAALAALLLSDVPLETAVTLLGNIAPATGRMQKLGGNNQLPLVIIDYAHTPDALEKTLGTLRETMSQAGQLYCVFGCGGSRDRTKRPLMAQAVAKFADHLMVTSDNPRTEDPESILDDIVAGLPIATHFTREVDRKSAIHAAIHQASPQDVVLIAGKGHETYQERNGVRYAFSDIVEAENALSAWGAS